MEPSRLPSLGSELHIHGMSMQQHPHGPHRAHTKHKVHPAGAGADVGTCCMDLTLWLPCGCRDHSPHSVDRMGRCQSCLRGAVEPLPLDAIRDILWGERDASQSLGLESEGRGILNRLPFNFSWFPSQPPFLFRSANSNLRKPAAWAPVGENTPTAAGRQGHRAHSSWESKEGA